MGWEVPPFPPSQAPSPPPLLSAVPDIGPSHGVKWHHPATNGATEGANLWTGERRGSSIILKEKTPTKVTFQVENSMFSTWAGKTKG